MPPNEKELNCYLFDQLTILDDLEEVAEKSLYLCFPKV